MRREYFYFNPKGEVFCLYVFLFPYEGYDYCYSTLTNAWYNCDGEMCTEAVTTDTVPVEYQAKLLLLI